MRILGVAVTVVLSFFSLVAVIVVAKSFGFSPSNFHDPAKIFDLSTVVTALAVLTAPILIVLVGQKNLIRQPITNLAIIDKKWIAPFFWGAAIGVSFKVFATLVAYTISPQASLASSLSGISFINWLPYFGWFIFALLINSFSEELTFRAFPIQNLGEPSLGRGALVVIISATAFSLMHFAIEGVEIYHFFYRMAFGLLAGFLFLRKRSLWLVVGLHTGWNFLALSINDSDWRTGTLVRLDGLRDRSEIICNIIILLIATLVIHRSKSSLFVRAPANR